MAVNKAEQTLDNTLINRMNAIEQQLITLKTQPQPIGADNIDTRASGTTATSPITVPTGSRTSFTITITPTSDFVLNLVLLEVSIFIDGTADGNKYPNGSLLTADAKKMAFENWHDWADSIESGDFHRAFKVVMTNNGASSHDYVMKFKLIYPKYTAA